MIIPGLVLVVDHSSSETPGRVNTGSGDRNGGKMNHENSKSNGERCQNLQFNFTFLVNY